jgi:4-hydroxy-L-threonine phosphate dehydrogenase PdxA
MRVEVCRSGPVKHIREIPDYVLSRDYAGKGVANPVSMIRAMKLAVGMAERQEYSFA